MTSQFLVAQSGAELESAPSGLRVHGKEDRLRTLVHTKKRDLVLKEADIQRTVCDHLRAEGWRVFEFEQHWDERAKKLRGEVGMPDILAIRYEPGVMVQHAPMGCAQVLWVELKRVTRRGNTTKAATAQLDWHRDERARGALTWIAGIDFPATIEGWLEHYRASGLARR